MAVPAYGSTLGTVINDSNYNAFPGLAQRANGDLIVAYRVGAGHLSIDGVMVTRKSTDQGATWGSQSTVASPAAGFDYRDANLFVSPTTGRWFLNTFDLNNANSTIRLVLFTSDNEGVTWSAPSVLSTSFTVEAATSGPVVELANGTLLMPIYGHSGGLYRCDVLFSTNNGATWGSQDTILDRSGSGFSVTECCLLVNADGVGVTAYIRQEGGTSGPLWRVHSADGGTTWGAAVQCHTGYPGRPSVARFDATDTLVLQYRQAGTEKPAWAYSHDDGVTWQGETVISNSIGVYGAFWPLADGSMGMVAAIETSNADIYYFQLVSGA